VQIVGYINTNTVRLYLAKCNLTVIVASCFDMYCVLTVHNILNETFALVNYSLTNRIPVLNVLVVKTHLVDMFLNTTVTLCKTTLFLDCRQFHISFLFFVVHYECIIAYIYVPLEERMAKFRYSFCSNKSNRLVKQDQVNSSRFLFAVSL